MSHGKMTALRATLLTTILGTTALAQLAIDWHTIDSGGVMNSTSASFTLSGTIAQPDAASNPALASTSFSLTGGFWPVANVCNCLGDMNGDRKKDGRDVQHFIDCVIAGGNCSCADLNAANGVELADVGAFVSDLLTDATCPM